MPRKQTIFKINLPNDIGSLLKIVNRPKKKKKKYKQESIPSTGGNYRVGK